MSQTARNRWRIVLLVIAFGGLGWLLWRTWQGLTPFLVGAVLAFVLMPLVDGLNRFLPRALAILLVYALLIGAGAAFVLYLLPIIVEQSKNLINETPRYANETQNWLNQTFKELQQSLPKDFQQPFNESINSFSTNAINFVRDALFGGVTGVVGWLFGTIGFLVGIFIIPFWLFFVLKDKSRGMRTFYSILPLHLREDAYRLLRVVADDLNDYIRGQLFVAASVGVLVTIGLLIVNFDASTAIFLGFIAGLFEVLPIVGPILGAIPAVIVALFTNGFGNVDMALKVVLVFVVIQQIEGNILIPKIAGDSTKLHPAVVMLVIIMGSEVAGLPGAIVAVPLTALIRDVYIYLYQRLVLGASPLEAESKIPSRQDEIEREKLRKMQRQLKRSAASGSSADADAQEEQPLQETENAPEDLNEQPKAARKR
ncbi:MAG TPA: AI-2E family transporter [Chloroflexia bacterium]|nr:AI-2E family transporter [Chloroflexia bacterium]